MGLEERGRALEEAFFAQKNKELLTQVKQDLNAAEQRDGLKEATGISDDAILDEILAMGVEAESLAALSIAPMVLVAWADGSIAEEEREAIMSGASKSGITADSTAGKLLAGWLSEQPDSSLQRVWADYTQAVCEKLQAGDHVKLRDRVMGRCQEVAQAAGGFLGIGSISAKEQEMLAALEKAFDPA